MTGPFGTILLVALATLSPPSTGAEVDRSPVDLVVAHDGRWLITINQSSDSASLVEIETGLVLDEIPVGERPAGIALCPDGVTVVVTGSYSGTIARLEVSDRKLSLVKTVEVGFEPHGVCISPDGSFAYVALTAAAQVAVIGLPDLEVISRIDCGRWPRYVAVTPDGSKLAVGTSGDRGVSVIDLNAGKMLYAEKFVGLNIGHLQMSNDGSKAWFPWVVYRQNPVSVGNIRLGWVLATRLGRVRMDGPARREAMSLDPPGKAIGDPHGLALTSDESRAIVSASGTQELLVYRTTDLPFQDYGGTDHVPSELLDDEERFARIDLGGRPMGLEIGPDDRTAFVANYFLNSVQVVDIDKREWVRSIPLGGPEEPDQIRRGEALFFDARRSLDQWYSCHTCHYEGGSNAVSMDTWNDESAFTFKTVLPLDHLAETEPWTWHGWQTDLNDAMKKSFTVTMQGEPPSDDEVAALIAYLKSRRLPRNPFLMPDGSLSPAAVRGKKVFESAQANCAECHNGEYFTDGDIHDVGTAGKRDKLEGYNTPALIGLYRKVEFLHDGRAKSLEDLLTGPHRPSLVSGTEDLSPEQVADLVAYLKSL